MKTRTRLVITTLSLTIVLAGCDMAQQALMGMKKPTASLKGIGFGDISLEAATLLFDVEIENPYAVDLPLLKMDYTVASGSSRLFSGKTDVATTIPAGGKQVVSLPAAISYTDLVKAFKGFKPGEPIPYNANLGLLVNAPAAGNIRLPLNKTGELGVPSMPGIDSVNWRELLLK